MWFALISSVGLMLLGPFTGPGACNDALEKAERERAALVYADGSHKPEWTGLCFQAERWKHLN